MTFDKINFGRALNFWMHEKRKTAKDIADAMEVTSANVSAQKQQRHVNTKILQRYMDFFGVSSIDDWYECRVKVD